MNWVSAYRLSQPVLYIFVNARHLSNDSYKLAFDILENAHVGVTPVELILAKMVKVILRFSYANSLENIIEGLNRLEKYIQDFKGL